MIDQRSEKGDIAPYIKHQAAIKQEFTPDKTRCNPRRNPNED